MKHIAAASAVITLVLALCPVARAEFCGGDESKLDEAYMLFEDEDFEGAKEVLVGALQNGEVYAWERGTALAMLAEAQLRLGEYRPAIINYRKAIEVDSDGELLESHNGLATALYLAGRTDEALEVATAFAFDMCGDPQGAPVACYGANVMIGLLTPDDTLMFESVQNAELIRGANPRLEESFADVRARLEPEGLVQIASVHQSHNG